MAASPLLTGDLSGQVSLWLPFRLAAAFRPANAVTFWVLFPSSAP